MRRIATTFELQTQLRRLLRYASTARPSRRVLAHALLELSQRVAARDKSAPSKVDKYFERVKESNPSYSDSQAWATAWSIYCKHVDPDSDSCHQDEYFKGR